MLSHHASIAYSRLYFMYILLYYSLTVYNYSNILHMAVGYIIYIIIINNIFIDIREEVNATTIILLIILYLYIYIYIIL